MAHAHAAWRRIVKHQRPLWHRAKQFGLGLCCISALELTLLYYYSPNRGYIKTDDYCKPFNINHFHNDPSVCGVPLERQELIHDIISIFNTNHTQFGIGLVNQHYAKNVIIDTPWYRWIGAKELKFYKKTASLLVPNPIVGDKLDETTDVDDNLWISVGYKTENELTLKEMIGGVVEQMTIRFHTKMKHFNQANTFIHDKHLESYDITLICDIDKNGKICYQRELYEGKPLITPNTNVVFGYFVRWITRSNAFWWRMFRTTSSFSEA